MNMSDIYVKIPIAILDDPGWYELPARLWREDLESFINNPDNWHRSSKEYRREWNNVRPKMRKLVFSLRENACAICGATERLEVDHIIPLSLGGSNDIDNLQILCKVCNIQKGNKLP